MRARRAPHVRLSGPLLDRELLGYQHSRAQFASWLEPPRGGSPSASGDTYGSIDLKLSPLGAYTLTGLPLSELTGACVPLDDVFGAAGREMVARIRESRDWDDRFDLLEDFLLGRLSDGPHPDPAVVWAWERLRASHGGAGSKLWPASWAANDPYDYP